MSTASITCVTTWWCIRSAWYSAGTLFAIVDEVDSIPIDEARTPLIISGEGEKPTDLYERADQFVRTLRKYVVTELDAKEEHDDIDADYIVDEKANTCRSDAARRGQGREILQPARRNLYQCRERNSGASYQSGNPRRMAA